MQIFSDFKSRISSIVCDLLRLACLSPLLPIHHVNESAGCLVFANCSQKWQQILLHGKYELYQGTISPAVVNLLMFLFVACQNFMVYYLAG